MAWDLDPSNVGTGLPLEGIRVLDLSRVLAGPLCAMVLGDLGADVVKVEAPSGDPVRGLAPPLHQGIATYFLAVNRHRRMVVIDVTTDSGWEQLANLVAQADIVVENYLPHQKEALRIEEMATRSPSTTWVSVTPATSGSPAAAQPTFDLLAQARSGIMDVTGYAGGPPTKVGVPIADVVTGLFAAIGALASVVGESRDRPVRRVEAPLLESMMSALINQAQGYLSTGVAPSRLGNDHPSIAPYGPIATRDGLVMLAVGTDAQWRLLLEAIGVSGADVPAEWESNAARVQGREAVTAFLESVMSSRETDEWVELLVAAKVPCAPIYTVPQALAQPGLVESGFIQTTDSVVGPLTLLATPLLLDGRRPPIRSGPRAFGADSDDVLR